MATNRTNVIELRKAQYSYKILIMWEKVIKNRINQDDFSGISYKVLPVLRRFSTNVLSVLFFSISFTNCSLVFGGSFPIGFLKSEKNRLF